MSDIKQLWNEAWSDSLGDTDLAEARVGGRATKANPDKEDSRWWNSTGPEWLEQYTTWRKNNKNWKIWVTPDGEPAIELGIIIKIADVDVKMVIDRVFEVDGQLVVVDLKTSQRTPSNTLQLGFYKIGLEKQYDIKIPYGNYYMSRAGGTGTMIDLSSYTYEKIEYMVENFDKARKAGLFLPNTNYCNTLCGLTEHCEFYPGKIG